MKEKIIDAAADVCVGYLVGVYMCCEAAFKVALPLTTVALWLKLIGV